MPNQKNLIPKPTIVLNRKTKMWEVCYTHPVKGYTVKRSTGKRNKAEARQAAQPIITDIVGKATGLTPSNANYRIGELLNAYKASKESIADTDERALKKLSEFFAAFTPEQLGDGAWKRYRKWRTDQDHVHASAQYQKTKKKVSDSTAIRELNVLRAAISWAQRSPHWKGLQHVRVTLPNATRPARQEFLTKEDAIKLVDACREPHLRLFVLLALATAARHRAILALRWDAIKWPSGSNTPSPIKDKGRYLVIADGVRKSMTQSQSPEANAALASELGVAADSIPQELDLRPIVLPKSVLKGGIHIDLGGDVGKKRKPIAVIAPSNVRLYNALVDAYTNRTTAYVIEWRQGGIGRKIDRVDLTDAYKRAGLKVPDAPQHVLKHTAISWLVQEGKEIAKISALTRTSIPTIEKVYGHLAPGHVELLGDVLSL